MIEAEVVVGLEDPPDTMPTEWKPNDEPPVREAQPGKPFTTVIVIGG